MFTKNLRIFLLFLILVQVGSPLSSKSSSFQQPSKQNVLSNNKVQNLTSENSLATTINYELKIFPTKSEYSIKENIVIILLLYSTETQNPIMDSVTVTTALGSNIIQLTQAINQITLNNADFIPGINIITVTYKSLSKSITILRQDPVTTGPIPSNITVLDILNKQPAPGVPEYINYSVINQQYLFFPTLLNEYFQVGLNYQGIFLVLATKFYPENTFILNNSIQFNIPFFLAFQTYNLQLSYSGDSFLQPCSMNYSITIHNFSPIITSNLSGTILDKSNVLNGTSNYLQVKIEGYLTPTLQVTIYLNSTIITQQNITNYRQSIALAIPNIQPSGLYELQASFSYIQSIPPLNFTYQVHVVNKIGLIIRTDTTYFTLGLPVLFDFFCYDPRTFSGVACSISMMNGSTELLSMQTSNGHYRQSITFVGLDTAKVYTFDFITRPVGNSNLFENDVQFEAKFYHNTSISVQIQKNIVNPTQLISLESDVNGIFTITDVNNLIIAYFTYNQAGMAVNYFITFNNTHRGLNTYEIDFTTLNSNYSNVTQKLTIYKYDTITIQNVQTNASFYQLNSFILMRGVATIGTELDSLNNVSVTLLLNGQIIANTTIQSNTFIFIIPAPNSLGLMVYEIAIYANDSQFILTSMAYELTVSVINDFGLLFENSTYQVGDTIQLQIFGLENRQYSLYYVIGGSTTILSNFTYKQSFNFDFKAQKFGHYLIYLQERSSDSVTYYGLNVLQNPTVKLNYTLLETYKYNLVNISMNNYKGYFSVKIDNLFQNYNSYYNNETGLTTLQLFNVRPGNHSITILFDNEYTLNRVRVFFVILYQRVNLASLIFSNNGKPITEEDSITMHLKFREFSNVSLNDIEIQIVTNDQTILAQANIFNSASDFQLTVIGNNLSLEIIPNSVQFIHEEIIPLNLSVYRLLTSNIKPSYSFNSVSTLQLIFGYKFFPSSVNLTMSYDLSNQNREITNTIYGQVLKIKLINNGQYNLTILVSGQNCVNQTFQTTITVAKLFDISNTGLITAIGAVISLPVAVVGITLLKKRKSLQ